MSSASLAVEQLEQCVRTACSEMGRQWREGRPVLAEDVLAQFPELANQNELALELIYTEYVVREELGKQCTNEEWFQRFPQWTTDLMQLLEVHRQLCDAETVQTAGSKWKQLSTAGSTDDSIELHRSTSSFGGRSRQARLPNEEQIGRLVGNYQLLEEIGRGGMGVVFRARQLNLNRDVALKMILSGEFASAREMNRFQTEAQSTAKLHHPNIVQIHEVGAHQQRPFLSMELITGGNLDSRLKSELPAPRQAAELLAQIARAVHYAHEQGVIHRDLKPCNVLLDEHGHPKVADFGLAKQLRSGQNECSRSMGPVGTPSYMAPESVGGAQQKVTPATDVYSLGVILYEMLTGTPPFVSDTQLETLRQIVHDEPNAPSVINRRTPRDLETICLKCLQKDPRRRYTSAVELAEDLDRFLRREPIKAKPVGALERCIKWTRRRPLEAAFVTFLGLSVLGMFALWRTAVASDFRARASAVIAVKNREIAEREKEHVLRNEYFLRIGQAQGEYLNNMVGRANELLEECPASMRHFEWNYLKRKCSSELLTMKGHKELLCTMAVTHDGNYAATGSGEWGTSWAGDIILWNLRSGKEVCTITPNEGPIMSLDFSPDGALLASASFPFDNLKSPGVKIWNTKGQLIWRLPPPADGSKSIKFSPNGKLLAVASTKGQIQIWHVEERRLLSELSGHTGMVLDIAFDPSGTKLASVGRDGFAIIHDLKTKHRNKIGDDYGDLRWVRFSPDGRYLAFANYGASIFNVDLASYLVGDLDVELKATRLSYDIDNIESFEYSPEGRRIGICSDDGSVLIINAGSGEVLQRLYTHNGMVRNLVFTEDNRIVTAASEGTVKVWELNFDKPIEQVSTGALSSMGSISRMRLTRDGSQILMTITRSNSWGRGYHVMLVYDLRTLKNLWMLFGHDDYLTDVVESPDGKYWATSSLDKTIILWDAAKGKEAKRFSFSAAVHSLRFNRDGRYVIAACGNGLIEVCDCQTGEITNRWLAHKRSINEIDLSPNGQLLSSCAEDGSAKIWDWQSGKLVHELIGHTDRTLTVTFSHDGQLLATGSADQTIKLWSVEHGREIRDLRAHVWQINDLDFSSDDRRLVSCSRDGFVKVWDVQSGREAISFREGGSTQNVAFHPKDELIVSTRDRMFQIYDARSNKYRVPDEEFAAKNFNWNLDQARLARLAGLTDVAKFNFARASEMKPVHDYEYRRRGVARASLERWKQAIADLSMAYSLGNKNQDLLPTLVVTCLADGDRDNCLFYSNLLIERAIQAYRRRDLTKQELIAINNDIYDAVLIDQPPQYAERLLGIMTDIVERSINDKEQYDATENSLAFLYMRCGWFDEAEEIMRRRPTDEKAYAEDWAIRSILAVQRSDLKTAQECYQRCSALCSGGPLVKQKNLPIIESLLYELSTRIVMQEAKRKLDAALQNTPTVSLNP